MNVAVVDEDEVAILAELGAVEFLDHETSTSEADELRSVKAIRVVEGARAVNDCRVCWSSVRSLAWLIVRRNLLVTVLSFESKISSV